MLVAERDVASGDDMTERSKKEATKVQDIAERALVSLGLVVVTVISTLRLIGIVQ